MAFNIRKFLEGIKIVPKSVSTVNEAGEMEVLSGNGKLYYRDSTGPDAVVTETRSGVTISNKTLTDTVSVTGGDAQFTVQSKANQNLLVQSQGTGNVSIQSSGSTGVTVEDVVVNANTVTGGASTLTVQSASNQNLSLQAQGTGVVNLESFTVDSTSIIGPLNQDISFVSLGTGNANIQNFAFSSNYISNAQQITIESGSNFDINLLTSGTGATFAGQIKLYNNNIIGDPASSLVVTTQNNQNLVLTANGTGRVTTTRPLQVSNILLEDVVADNTTGVGATLATPSTSVIRLTNVGLVSVNMIPAGADGQNLKIVNTSGTSVTFNDDTGTVGSKIRTGLAGPLVVADNASIQLVYNAATQYWMIIGGSGGGGGGAVSDTVYGPSWNGSTLVAPSQNAVYDIISSILSSVVSTTVVGSAAQVTAGLAQYSSIQSAITASSPNTKILVLAGTYSENISVNKAGLLIEGQGYGSVINGTMTLTSSAQSCNVKCFKVTNNITFDLGSSNNFMQECWQTTGYSVTDNGSTNVVSIIQE
jgi:hypothetical protein